MKIQKEKYNKGCLMISVDTPSFIKDIQNNINKDDLYSGDDVEESIETDSHITIVYGLDNDVFMKDINTKLIPIKDIIMIPYNLSIFYNDKYDVLKCDISTMQLKNIHDELVQEFKINETYETYHPHMTIAYIKKCKADKFKKDMINKLIILNTKSYCLSHYDESKDKNIIEEITI